MSSSYYSAPGEFPTSLHTYPTTLLNLSRPHQFTDLVLNTTCTSTHRFSSSCPALVCSGHEFPSPISVLPPMDSMQHLFLPTLTWVPLLDILMPHSGHAFYFYEIFYLPKIKIINCTLPSS